MNSIEALLAKPIFQALGWALVHFIWQGALVAALYGVLSVSLRRCAANVRYCVACAALALMVALPLATMLVMKQSPARSLDDAPGDKAAAAAAYEATARPDFKAELKIAPQTEPSSQSAANQSSLAAAESGSFKAWMSERFASLLPWLVAAWFAGVLLLSVRFLGGLIVAARLKHHETNPLLHQWQEKLSALAVKLKVSRPVRLCESLLVEVPTVIGWMRPVILVPASALTGLSREQLEALLAHELAHVRRYDYLINLLQTAVETLLFYHPAVWWVSGQIRKEREHCCDDLAVAACGSVLVYARALAELEQLRSVAPQLAMAANGGSLLDRIQRLVGSPARRSQRLESGLAGVIALATILSLVAGAQTTILSRSTPIDDAPDARAFSHEAAPSRTTDKPTRDQNQSQKQSAKSQVRPTEAEFDQSKNAAEAEQADQDEENLSSNGEEPGEKVNDSQDFATAVKELGYAGLSDDELFAMKTHAVTPQFIRDVNALLSKKLSVEELVACRIHGVSPEFISEMKNLGYTNLYADNLIAFRIHGVSPSFVQQMKDLGYDRVSADQLVALRIHGVTANFIQAMKTFIRGNISIDELTGMRIHGATPEFVKELEILGYANLSPDQIMGFRIHGVTSSYIQALQSFGYRPSADQLMGLRIHAITPEFIEAVKSRGFNDVTIGQLIELRRMNIVPGASKK